MVAAPGELTDRERAILGLLAEGHTVKSAIAHTGDSEAAANELLRSARRKLGVGSSREAARIYAAQKNRDEISVMDGAAPRRSGPWPFITGGIIVALTVLIILMASGALSTGGKPAASGSTAPQVVSSSPADGGVVEPGPFTLSVTFDREMQRDSFSFASGPENAPPQCDGKVRAADNGRTFSMECVAAPGQKYVIWANHGSFMNFRSAETGMPAMPYRITFSSTR